jgi:hypothetical protein
MYAASMRNSNTSLLSTPYLNYKRTALVFANKDMALVSDL